MRRARVVPCVPVDGLHAVVVLCRDVDEQAVTARTPAPRSSPRLPSLAGARQSSFSVLARHDAVRRSPRRARLRPGLRAKRSSFLQVLVCAATAWPGAPQRRARASRSCVRTPERCHAPRASKPPSALTCCSPSPGCSGVKVCAKLRK
jgi:hypothetical protein